MDSYIQTHSLYCGRCPDCEWVGLDHREWHVAEQDRQEHEMSFGHRLEHQ
jgi:hypothetical protein